MYEPLNNRFTISPQLNDWDVAMTAHEQGHVTRRMRHVALVTAASFCAELARPQQVPGGAAARTTAERTPLIRTVKATADRTRPLYGGVGINASRRCARCEFIRQLGSASVRCASCHNIASGVGGRSHFTDCGNGGRAVVGFGERGLRGDVVGGRFPLSASPCFQ